MDPYEIAEDISGMDDVAMHSELNEIHNQLADIDIAIDKLDTADTVVNASNESLSDNALQLSRVVLGYSFESSENSSGTLKRIWDKIIEAFLNAMKAIANFWKRWMGNLNRLKQAIWRLKKRAKSYSGSQIAIDTIIMNAETRYMGINGSPVSHGPEMAKGVLEFERQIKVVLSDYVYRVDSLGRALIVNMGNDRSDPKEYLKGMIKSMNALKIDEIANKLQVKPYLDIRFRKGEVESAVPPIGNKSIFLRRSRLNSLQAMFKSTLAEAEEARRASVFLANSTNEEAPVGDYEMRTADVTTIQQIVDSLDNSLDIIIEYSDSNIKKSIMKNADDLVAATNELRGWIDKNIRDQGIVDYYRSAVRFLTTYANWATRPHDQLIVHFTATARAIISVCHKCLSCHR